MSGWSVGTSAITAEMFSKDYADVFAGDDRWRSLPTPTVKTGSPLATSLSSSPCGSTT